MPHSCFQERCTRLTHSQRGDADVPPLRQDDPDLQPMLADIQKNGMGALMKYWNDPMWLSKVGGKLGDVTAATAQAQGAAVPAQAPRAAGPTAPPEVNTLFDAAKCGLLAPDVLCEAVHGAACGPGRAAVPTAGA